jgi:hypothetical protein
MSVTLQQLQNAFLFVQKQNATQKDKIHKKLARGEHVPEADIE